MTSFQVIIRTYIEVVAFELIQQGQTIHRSETNVTDIKEDRHIEILTREEGEKEEKE